MRTRPDKISRIELHEGYVTVDEHGYLTDPTCWTLEFAHFAAKTEDIELTEQHIEIINFVRAQQAEHGIIPDARVVFKFIGEKDGLSKSAAKKVLYRLFPYGYVKQTCKIAGMKQPRAWSTG